MSINTQRLFEAKAKKFGTSIGSVDFNAIFLDALQSTLRDVENDCLISTTQIEDIQTDIDLDDAYANVVGAGLDFYLQESHLFTVQSLGDVAAIYERAKASARHTYLDSLDLKPRFGNVDDEDGDAD